MPVAFISLGSNLGDRFANLQSALDQLRELGSDVRASPVYETEPVDYEDQPLFLNAVARLETGLSASELLRAMQGVEDGLGRERAFRYGPRTLDLDLLLYDDAVIDLPGLTVPHPRLRERAFALAPMAEIAPDARDPVTGKTAVELLAAIDPPVALTVHGRFDR